MNTMPAESAPTVPTNTVTFTPSCNDALAAYRLRYKPTILRLAAGAAVVVIFVVLMNAIVGLPTTALLIAIAVSIVIYLLLALLIRRLMLPWQVRRLYRQQAGLRRETTFAWDEVGLRWRTEHGTGLTPWSDYLRRREDADVILLYHSDALFQFIPRRHLNQAQQAELARCVAAVPLNVKTRRT